MECNKIILKPSEYSLAVYLSSVRTYVNEYAKVADKKMGYDDGFLIGVDGLVGEFGVCKHFNVCPDLSFEPRKGGADCVINGNRIDVKSTKPGRDKVFVPEWKAKDNIDRYIFCTVQFRTIEILGWFLHKDIFRDDNLEPSPRPNVKHHALLLENLRKNFKGEIKNEEKSDPEIPADGFSEDRGLEQIT
jgi:hypothetical protein